MSHICSQVGRPRFGVRWAGRVLEVRSYRQSQARGGIRGRVKSRWSQGSRNRLVKMLEALEWSVLRWPLAWVGLTYPGEWSVDGRRVKRDLKCFRDRWARRFGPPRGVWKLEFQRRGMPHFHLLLEWPEGVEIGPLRLWVAQAWYEVVGSGDDDHRLVGTSVDEWRENSPAAYFAGYGMWATKEYQNRAPDGFAPGRWWGVWGMRPQWREVEITEQEFYRVRRVLVRLAKARGRRTRLRREWQGVWQRGDGLARLVPGGRML